jgi:DNA primase
MSAFDVLRERIDLVEVAGRFTDLRPSGRAHVGRCPHPNHEDRNPSFHVYPDEGRFYCYGCRSSGDVTDLWASIRGVEPGIGAALDLAREFGVELPSANPDEQEQAEERRRLEAAYLQQAEEAHDALRHLPRIEEFWERRGFGEHLQNRFLLGAAEDGTEATIPFWNRAQVHGVIRRKLQDDAERKYLLPKKDDLLLGHRPLFVPGRVASGMIVVEGYVDALALAALGYGVAAVGGTHPSQEQLEELRRLPGVLYVLPDADEPGRRGGRQLVDKLYPKALLCEPNYEMEDNNRDY